MGSKKRSAQKRQIAEFKASLAGFDDMDDLFAREDERKRRTQEEHEAAHRQKACESKNRYDSRSEAEAVAAECTAHGAPALEVYRCPYCKGWHLTSHPWHEK